MRHAVAFATFILAAALAGCAAHPQTAQMPNADPGQTHFESYCAACHQYDGQGMGEAPPLDGSPWVSGPPERLIKIVLHGVRGSMEIEGKTYNREMPAFGQILSDSEIASLLSFVRRRFASATEPLTPAEVSRIRSLNQSRKDYWSVEELLAGP